MFGIDIVDGVALNAPLAQVFTGKGLRPGCELNGLGGDVVAHAVPQLFSDKRDKRMQQADGAGEYVVHDLLNFLFTRCVVTAEHAFGIFDIPVAIVMPHEVIQGQRRVIEAVPRQIIFRIANGFTELGENMLVVRAERHAAEINLFGVDGCIGRGVHLHEARRVPDFGAEVPAHLEFFIVNVYILAGCRQHHQAEAQGIGTVC